MRNLIVIVFVWLLALPASAQESSPNLLDALGGLFKAKPATESATAVDTGAATRNLRPVAATSGEKRVALVIGNNAYQTVPVLEKASNDARAVGRALEQAGFQTRSIIDGNRTQMNQAINQFVEDVGGGGIGVFFFAGHGVQVNNQNFLIPIDLPAVAREADIADHGISLQNLQDKIADARAKFSLLVVDACRDNPLPKKAGRSIGATRGLTQASSAEGQIVVFSAGANQQALDKLADSDQHPNGVFTREFLPWVTKPGVSIRDAVLSVRSAVRAKAKTVDHDQFPAIYDQAEGNFYFIFQGPATVNVQPVAADPESDTWRTAERANSDNAYRAYLEAYPQGKYATAARIALEALKPGKAKPGVTTAPDRPATAVPPAPTLSKPVAADDPETAFWNEVKASGSKEYYEAYLKSYPKGKYVSLAKLELKKIDDAEKAQRAKDAAERKAQQAKAEAEKQAAAEREKQERIKADQDAWEAAKKESTVTAYAGYLSSHPQGRYAGLAQVARQKAEKETAEREKQEVARREREAKEAEQRRQAEAERQRLAAEQARIEVEKAAKEMRPGKVFKDCPDCPEMVVIPVGSFEMGSNSGASDEKPVHSVRIGKAFALAKTEVTQKQWRAIMGSDPAELKFKGCDDCPVERVNWNEVKEFTTKLSQMTGKTYRLPSEAEWEYACRAGGTHTYCGSDNVDNVAWYDKNSGSKTHAVAGKQANAWGLYDMSGNVWEWTEDCWNGSYSGAPTDGSAWITGECVRRVLRGGSWYNNPQYSRAASRIGYVASRFRGDSGGFRPGRMLP
jgi:formylglycine-generating enzyme required for sulfatase activity